MNSAANFIPANGSITGAGSTSTTKPEARNLRPAIVLALVAVLIAGALTSPMSTLSVQPGQLKQPAVCTLACDPVKHTCSRYPSNQVPSSSVRHTGMPSSYTLVPGGTRCDATACVQDPYLCVIGNT